MLSSTLLLYYMYGLESLLCLFSPTVEVSNLELLQVKKLNCLGYSRTLQDGAEELESGLCNQDQLLQSLQSVQCIRIRDSEKSKSGLILL